VEQVKREATNRINRIKRIKPRKGNKIQNQSRENSAEMIYF
jgi:hypothetical protein